MEQGQVVAARFVIERLAGSGGMGEVYLARDRAGGTPAAVKLVRAGSVAQRDRFLREAQILSSLRHPSIVRYLAHGDVEGGRLFLAMEWLEGEDLAGRLARGPLSVAECASVLSQLVEALACAHESGVIHRDLKPSNVFLLGGDADRVKLLDFGVARLAVRRPDATRTGMLLGTPGYMSPEQARGDRDIDVRTDVFSLGCVLFECLAGRPAFLGEHVIAVLAKVLLEEAPSLAALRPDVPPRLSALVARMLRKARDDRPASMSTLRDEIAAHAQPGASPDVPAPTSLGSEEQRRLFVVLARERTPTVDVGAPTMVAQDPAATATQTGEAGANEEARSLGASFQARAEHLLDGTIVLTLEASGSASDGAARAARCALRLRSRFPSWVIALATGRGVLSHALPLGEVIDRAVSLLRSGSDGAVRVDSACASLLDAQFDVRGAELHGDDAPVTTRRLLGRPSPCVGRDRELSFLWTTFSECVEEPVARAVLLTAPPGVGKSRLGHELVHRVLANDHACQVWRARGDALAGGSAFALLAQLVRRTAGIREGEDLEVRRERLRARVAQHVPGSVAARVTEFLGELCGVPFSEEQSVQLAAARKDPRLMADQLQSAWEELLRAECAVHPVLIVIEDLHWGDLPSVKHLDWALRKLAEAPLFVLALARPEVRDLFPGLWAERGLQEVHLSALSTRSSEKLVRQMLEATSPEVVARIVSLSAGNAFFLEELIRTVAAGQTEELPESVLAMVQVRHEALEPEARQILRAASVLGEVFWTGAIRSLIASTAAAERLEEWLEILCERELIERHAETRFADQVEYAFRHALVREAAYATLTDADRVLGHRLAAAWLERAGESDAMRLGEHLDRAGEHARAVQWYRRAAEQALEGGDLAGSLARAARARQCGAAGEDLVALDLLELEVAKWQGRRPDVAARAAALVAALPVDSSGWYTAVAEVAQSGGKLKPLEAALLTLDPRDRASFVVTAARVVTQTCINMRAARAAPLFEKLEALGTALGDRPEVMGWVAQAQAFRAASADDIGETLRLLRLARASFERAGDARNAFAQAADEGFALVELGRYTEATETGRAVLTYAEPRGIDRLLFLARLTLSISLARLGDFTEARANAHAACADTQNVHLSSLARVYLATIELCAGDLAAAERAARDAQARISAVQRSAYDARSTLALVLLAQGRAGEVLPLLEEPPHFQAVLTGSEGGPVRHHLARAEAHRALGQLDQARSAIATARDLLRARASCIGDPALRAGFLADVADHARTLALAELLGA